MVGVVRSASLQRLQQNDLAVSIQGSLLSKLLLNEVAGVRT